MDVCVFKVQENKELNHKEVQEMGANITPKISKLIKSFVPLLKG